MYASNAVRDPEKVTWLWPLLEAIAGYHYTDYGEDMKFMMENDDALKEEEHRKTEELEHRELESAREVDWNKELMLGPVSCCPSIS